MLTITPGSCYTPHSVKAQWGPKLPLELHHKNHSRGKAHLSSPQGPKGEKGLNNLIMPKRKKHTSRSTDHDFRKPSYMESPIAT